MPELYEALSDDIFKARCKIAFQNAAIAVMAEADTVEHHAQRVQLCGKIFDGSLTRSEMACGMITNTAVKDNYIAGVETPDDTLNWTASSIFDAFALSLCPLP